MKLATIGSIFVLLVTIAAGGSSAATSLKNSRAPETAAGAVASASAARTVELRPGTVVAVRVSRALSTTRNGAGDTFDAILDEPVVVSDRAVLPRGTRFHGHVTRSAPSGRLEGRAVLGVRLDAFTVNGRRYPITTSINTRTSEAHKKRNIQVIGGSTGVGALIGGLAGGGKGAAIGAAVGAGAGTGAAAATGKKNVGIAAETLLRFSLKTPVTIPE
jgi:hypothetical protein